MMASEERNRPPTCAWGESGHRSGPTLASYYHTATCTSAQNVPPGSPLCQLLDRLFEHLDARGHVGRRVLRVGLVLDADVALELHVPQGLEHGRHVEHALAVD